MSRDTVRFARITNFGTDTKQFAVQQMEYLGKVADGLIVFPYGLHGNVPADAMALMFAVGGDAENRAAIAWTPKIRPQLEAGEVAYYHPPTGTIIKLVGNSDIDIVTGNEGGGNVNITCAAATITASGSVTLDTPQTTITGDVQIDGDLTVTGQSTAADHVSDGISGNSHVHGGVVPGGANTLGPV